MSVDWLKIGLNSAEKITLLSLRIPLEVNSEILFSPYKLPQPSGYEGTQLWSIAITWLKSVLILRVNTLIPDVC